MAQTPPPTKTQPAAPKAPVKSSTPTKSTTKTGAPATKQAAPAAATLTTDEQKTVYALGLFMYKQLGQFDLSPAEMELFKKGLADAAAGKPALELDTWMPKIQPLAQSRAPRVAEREKASSAAFLAKSAGEPGAIKTTSGLIYRELKPGTGASPRPPIRSRFITAARWSTGLSLTARTSETNPRRSASTKSFPAGRRAFRR